MSTEVDICLRTFRKGQESDYQDRATSVLPVHAQKRVCWVDKRYKCVHSEKAENRRFCVKECHVYRLWAFRLRKRVQRLNEASKYLLSREEGFLWFGN